MPGSQMKTSKLGCVCGWAASFAPPSYHHPPLPYPPRGYRNEWAELRPRIRKMTNGYFHTLSRQSKCEPARWCWEFPSDAGVFWAEGQRIQEDSPSSGHSKYKQAPSGWRVFYPLIHESKRKGFVRHPDTLKGRTGEPVWDACVSRHSSGHFVCCWEMYRMRSGSTLQKSTQNPEWVSENPETPRSQPSRKATTRVR